MYSLLKRIDSTLQVFWTLDLEVFNVPLVSRNWLQLRLDGFQDGSDALDKVLNFVAKAREAFLVTLHVLRYADDK